MKKPLLILLSIYLLCSFSAQAQYVALPTMAPQQKIMGKAPQQTPNGSFLEKPVQRTEIINGRAVTYVPIGSSDNAYGFYGNPRTYLWADPDLNSLVFVHQYGNQIAYDLSTDGGATWETNNVLTNSMDLAVGPPQGAIMNEAGNTDPDAAFISYFSLADDNTSVGWTIGSNPLTATNPTNPNTANYYSSGEIIRSTPSAFTATQQGKTWFVGSKLMPAFSGYIYNGELEIGNAVILNNTLNYNETALPFLAEGESINDIKVAFGPDGQTGYILVLSDSQSDPQPFSNYHPILIKTTDGGESWSDPIHIQLGGADGIESVKYYWPDTTIENLDAYEPGFDRNEIWYNMGYHADIIVDHNNNPHITGIIALASEEGWYPYAGAMATWHVYSNDGGTTFDADALYNNRYMEGAVGSILQYNRPYAASTYDGHILLFSWLDTDKASATDLNDPNIYVIGYDAEDGLYAYVQNVTAFGLWWFNAYFGSMSQYVFSNEIGGRYDTEIPIVFEEFTGTEHDPCNFWYIKGFVYPTLPVNSFVLEETLIKVSQNQPNPAKDKTEILVHVQEKGMISLKISNINGQAIYEEQVRNNAQVHAFKINSSAYSPGVYIYTVSLGGISVTKKMVVE